MTAAEVTAIPMTVKEESDLVTLENAILDGLETFVAVGTALAEINERRLYRATHGTFEAYVQDRFGISRSFAYRKIEGARIVAVVSPIGDTPNEAQARQLSGLNDESVRAAWAAATELATTTGSKLTASTVRAARQQMLPSTCGPRPRPRRPLPDALRSAVYDTVKQAAVLGRLVRDERFDDHHEVLASGLRSALVRLVEDLQAVLDALDLGSPGPAPAAGGRRAPIELTVGSNTAFIHVTQSMRAKVYDTLRRLDVRHQSSGQNKPIKVPAARADDVAAALEYDGLFVNFVRTEETR